MDYVNAFWVGGLICALCQILMEKPNNGTDAPAPANSTKGGYTPIAPKTAPEHTNSTIIRPGCIFVFSIKIWQRAGASVPLLGFGNTLFKGIKEAVDTNGFIGIFMGGFTATAVGISAALVFAYLASLIFEPKMRK